MDIIKNEFYSKVIGLKPLVKWDKGAYFLVGDFWFCLNMDDKRQPTSCYTHYAFTVSKANFEIMLQKIITSGAEIFKENTSPGESLYFFDPDSHKLEIHVGNCLDRIKAKKENPGSWKNVGWFV